MTKIRADQLKPGHRVRLSSGVRADILESVQHTRTSQLVTLRLVIPNVAPVTMVVPKDHRFTLEPEQT